MLVKRTLVAMLCCFVYLLLPTVGMAECEKKPPGVEGIVPFLEPSYMTSPTAFHNHLWFEGSIAMHFTVFRNYVQTLKSNCPNKNWSVLFTPGVVVRMYQSDSSPVRTPSYMPRLDLQELWKVHYNDPRRSGESPTAGFGEWHLTVGHHSNGQDGCVYTDQHRENKPDGSGDTVCVNPSSVPPAVLHPPSIDGLNRKDGSFSTNFVRGGISYRHSRLDTVDDAKWDLSAGGEYQRQFDTDPEIEDLLAKNHLSGRIASSWRDVNLGLFHVYRFQTEFSATVALAQPDLKPHAPLTRWTFVPKVSVFPWSNSNLGLFVKVFRGQDYYNMNFPETIPWKLRGGVEFSQEGFFKIHR